MCARHMLRSTSIFSSPSVVSGLISDLIIGRRCFFPMDRMDHLDVSGGVLRFKQVAAKKQRVVALDRVGTYCAFAFV